MSDNQNSPNPNVVIIIIIAIFVLFFILKVVDPQPEVKMYDPARSQAVTRAVEAAEIRSDFTLTDEQVKEIAERTSLQEIRKNR